MKIRVGWIVLSAALFAAQAQVADQVRRATISGAGGAAGKCTVEVRVDSSAEVDVYGDSGRLRTIAGQPATWTRMECSGPLPYSMSDFRFKGIDGRGSVKLAQDPRTNNSMAVIRIDDPKSGAEGYTFQIEWSGGSGGAPTGFQTGWGSPGTPATDSVGNRLPRRGRGSGISAERAIDLCRSEVRTRGERDYGLRDIDITSAAADTLQGRSNWVTGAFRDRGGASRRRAGEYRFNCEVDYSSGQVRSMEILRADGSSVQPGGTISGQNAQSNPAGYDQSRVFRACQDAVVARANRDGYQNIAFSTTAVDAQRREWVSGTITARRGPVTDTFDFGCSMDFRAASVRNVELNRR